MFNEILPPYESLLAHLARKWCYPFVVELLVNVQTSSPIEGFPTYVAVEAILAGVVEYVRP